VRKPQEDIMGLRLETRGHHGELVKHGTTFGSEVWDATLGKITTQIWGMGKGACKMGHAHGDWVTDQRELGRDGRRLREQQEYYVWQKREL
jgi:hypothetical protein